MIKFTESMSALNCQKTQRQKKLAISHHIGFLAIPVGSATTHFKRVGDRFPVKMSKKFSHILVVIMYSIYSEFCLFIQGKLFDAMKTNRNDAANENVDACYRRF